MRLLVFLVAACALYGRGICMPALSASGTDSEETALSDHSHLLETQISHATTAKENDEANTHVKENGHEIMKRNTDDHHGRYEKRSGTDGDDIKMGKKMEEHSDHEKRSIDATSADHQEHTASTLHDTLQDEQNTERRKRHSDTLHHHATHSNHTEPVEKRQRRNSDQGFDESNENELEEVHDDSTISDERYLSKRNSDNHNIAVPEEPIIDENASESSHHDLNERSVLISPEAAIDPEQ